MAHACYTLVVTQPVVMALQAVADEPAHGQRQVPVRATVLQRHRRAVLKAIEYDRLAEDDAAERLACNLAVSAGHVPVVPEEHGGFLRPLAVTRCRNWPRDRT